MSMRLHKPIVAVLAAATLLAIGIRTGAQNPSSVRQAVLSVSLHL